MDKFILMLIVAFSSIARAKADREPEIRIFEIRKERDDRDRRNDFRIDTEYYDPDGYELNNKIELYRANPSTYKNNDIDQISDNLINKLRRIVQLSNRFNQDNDDDFIFDYKSLKDDEEIEDNLKTPVVLVTHKDVLYHIIPQYQKSGLDRLQTALRSVNFDVDVEDRTAPPRTKVRYDYEYED